VNVLIALFSAAALAASAAAPAPPAERLPVLAADFAAKLDDVTVRTPNGDATPVVSVLDTARLAQALATIGDAEAWPAAWLVVQDLGLPWDLVVRVALGPGGTIDAPAAIFATPRREWDHEAFESAYRDAFGRKAPREKARNLVVQTFSKNVVMTYVYDLPKTGPGAKGLMALLPEGSLLRESRAIRWSDGRLLTVAIVLVRPSFRPSTCRVSAGMPRDHADAGGVMAYLAGEKTIEASIDLSEHFRDAAGGDPLVPRYACAPEDEDPQAAAREPGARFEGRALVRLLETFRPDDGRDEIHVRVAGLDVGRGRREAALVRISAREGGPGFELTLE
jgi:hypothetical protein